MFAGIKEQFQKTGAALPFGRKDRPVPQRTGRAPKAAPPTEGGVRRLLRETRSELKKVAWPTREQATRLTAIVIAVSAAVGVFVGAVDLVFKTLFQILLGAG